MKIKQIIAATILSSSVLMAASHAQAQDPLRVGASVYGLRGEFMQLWANALKSHPSVKDGSVEVTIFDARYDASVQDSQIDTMIVQQFDAILFVPIDVVAGATSVDKAVAAGIPVVGSNTRVATNSLTSFVGSDDVLAGSMVAKSVISGIGNKGSVVIIEGPIGQSAQIDRAEGIKLALKEFPDVKVLEKRTANWSRSEALSLMENWLTSHQGKISGVIAQNDEMALGAIQAIQALGYSTDTIKVAGVDGISDAIRAVKTGEMTSVLQDAVGQAQGALDVALRAVIGEKYLPRSPIWKNYGDKMLWKDGLQKSYSVPWSPITTKNADSLLEGRK